MTAATTTLNGFETINSLIIGKYNTFSSERSALGKAHADQVAQLAQSQKIRAANDSLAGKTQKLADAGNANAQLVISQLK